MRHDLVTKARSIRWIAASMWLLLSLVCIRVAHAEVGHQLIDDQWYVVLIQDQRVGWMHTQVTRLPDKKQIQTQAQTKITVRRGRLDMSIAIETRFLESLDGLPIEAEVSQTLGQMSTTQVMYFDEDTVEVVSRQGGAGGQESRKVLPMPVVEAVGQADQAADWLTPAAAQRHVKQKMADGNNQIRFWTIDPSTGLQPVHLWMARGQDEVIEVYGRQVHATVWDTTISIMPGIQNREYLDAQGNMVKSSLSLIPGMEFTIVAADQQLALSPADPPELMAATLVKPDREIVQPREVTSAVFELKSVSADLGGAVARADRPALPGKLDIPETGLQQVQRLAPDHVRVTINLNEPIRKQIPHPGQAYLENKAVLGTGDPVIKNLVAKVLDDHPPGLTQSQQAEKLRAFVHGFIQEKDLSVGFGTAGEVARTRQGDCTEHAVLLAAMLRVAGIPSRTVSGLIYADQFVGQTGVFAYHMWAQAWIKNPDTPGGTWVDLDPTLGQTAFDATHITLGTSSMADDMMVNDMVRMVPMIGRLQIRINRLGRQGSMIQYQQ